MLPRQPMPMPLPAPSTKLQVENVIVVPPGEQKVVLRDVALCAQSLVRGLGSSGRAAPASPRSPACWWEPGSRWRARSASTVRPSINGPRRPSGSTSATCLRMSSSLPAALPRTLRASIPRPIPRRSSRPRSQPMCTTSSSTCPTATTPRSAMAVPRCRPASVSAWRLARALYGDPFLVVLDEPDASLDQDGEQALQKAILGVRARGGIVIVISHRQIVLGAVDLLLALEHGRPLACWAEGAGSAETGAAAGRHGPYPEVARRPRRPGLRYAHDQVATLDPAQPLGRRCRRPAAGRKRRRMGRNHGHRRRRHRAGCARCRHQRPQGPAPDRWCHRRDPGARRRSREGRRHRGAPRCHHHASQPRHRDQGSRRASRPQGPARGRTGRS